MEEHDVDIGFPVSRIPAEAIPQSTAKALPNGSHKSEANEDVCCCQCSVALQWITKCHPLMKPKIF